MSLHDLAKAHPGLVKLDDVISVDVAAAAGVHVYDFTTLSGAYFAAGILLHNCRCYALPMKWRTEDMTSPSGKTVPVKRPTEGDKGEGSLNFKTAVVDWVRANPETTKQIFGRKIGEMLLGENGQKRIGLDRAVKLWQAPKAS